MLCILFRLHVNRVLDVRLMTGAYWLVMVRLVGSVAQRYDARSAACHCPDAAVLVVRRGGCVCQWLGRCALGMLALSLLYQAVFARASRRSVRPTVCTPCVVRLQMPVSVLLHVMLVIACRCLWLCVPAVCVLFDDDPPWTSLAFRICA